MKTNADVIGEALAAHQARDFNKAEAIYLGLLEQSPTNPVVLIGLGSLYVDIKAYAIAIPLIAYALDKLPDDESLVSARVAGMSNMGLALHRVGHRKSAERIHSMAAEIDPSEIANLVNWSGCYINSGTPARALELAERALKVDPEYPKALWHKALALLEMQRWETGWDYFDTRMLGGHDQSPAARNYHGPDGVTPWWDGKPTGLLAVHGEQGLGDEALFASCLPDVRPLAHIVVLECAPRLTGLMARSFPWLRVNGTHKLDGAEWIGELGLPDAKVALGSLPKFFRRSVGAFPRVPYLIADMKRRMAYRERLNALPKRPNIGISWSGGSRRTHGDVRSMELAKLAPILRQDANFLSLQYTMGAEAEIAALKAETGLEIHHWPEAARGTDMDDQAALIAELDLVVSVCQTAIHVAGGLGVPCWVLVPSRPAWRYGVAGDRSAWYSDAQKYWRQTGEDWEPVIEQVAEAMHAHFGKLQAA